MGLSRIRSARVVFPAIIALSTPALAIVANFTDGNGSGTPDSFPGIAGDGWAGPWLHNSGSTQNGGATITATVTNTSPLLGGGNYLSAVGDQVTNTAGNASVALDRGLVEQGLYPAVDPLASTSRILDPLVVGAEHYAVASGVVRTLQRYKDLQDIIAILGIDELSEDDKLAVARARRIQRFLTQPNFVAEQFTGIPGQYVPIRETVRGFKEILDGQHDTLPEQAFYMVGTIEQAVEKAASMAQ